MYKDGLSTKEVAEAIGITPRGVRYIFGKYGVDITEHRRTNGYSVNADFFSEWTNEMAYVLGFVLTDGCVSGNTLTISQKDPYILERIGDAMGSTYRITERANGKGRLFTLAVHRKKIVEDLRNLGIVEKKSRVVEFPEVPAEHLPHFIRGVIDGDGWVQ